MNRSWQIIAFASCLFCSAAWSEEPKGSTDDTTRKTSASKQDKTSSKPSDRSVSRALHDLRGWLKETPLQPESLTSKKLEKVEDKLVDMGQDALPTLMAVLKDNQASDAEKFVALSVVVKLDSRGTYSDKLLDLLEAGELVVDLRGRDFQSGSYLFYYWNRHLYKEADFDRMVNIARTNKKYRGEIIGYFLSQMLPRHRAKYYPELILTMKDEVNLAKLLLHSDYRSTSSPELRNAYLKTAGDKSKRIEIRADAVIAWAAGATPQDYDQLQDLMQEIGPWNFASQSHTKAKMLGRLDWRRAREQFSPIIDKVIEKAEAQAKIDIPKWQGRKSPSPFLRIPGPAFGIDGYDFYRLLAHFGSESQLNEAFAIQLEYHEKLDRNIIDEAGLWRLRREMAPLSPVYIKRISFAYPNIPIALNRGFGKPIAPIVQEVLEAKDPWHAVELAGELSTHSLPIALLQKHRKKFIQHAKNALEKTKHDPSQPESKKDEQHEIHRWYAFIVLCRLAPEQADRYLETIKDHFRFESWAAEYRRTKKIKEAAIDNLKAMLSHPKRPVELGFQYTAGGILNLSTGRELPFFLTYYRRTRDSEKKYYLLRAILPYDEAFAAKELYRMFQQERNDRRRLELADTLSPIVDILPADARADLLKEYRKAMQHSTGNFYLRQAFMLDMMGDKDGKAAFQSFIDGRTPRTPSTFLLDNVVVPAVLRKNSKQAERALERLTRIIQAHPNPEVRVDAIRSLKRLFLEKVDPSRRNPMMEVLIGQLDPGNDWRVRVAAGDILRRILKDVYPSWDYYAFWPRKKQQTAIAHLREWWQKHHDQLNWVTKDQSDVGIAHFSLKPN